MVVDCNSDPVLMSHDEATVYVTLNRKGQKVRETVDWLRMLSEERPFGVKHFDDNKTADSYKRAMELGADIIGLKVELKRVGADLWFSLDPNLI